MPGHVEPSQLLVLSLGFAATFATSTAPAQCLRYAVQIPAPLACGSTDDFAAVRSLSEHGHVVGFGGCGAEQDQAVIAWDAQQLVRINLQGTSWSHAEQMNENLQVVGTHELVGIGRVGFIYSNGQATNLDWLPGDNWAEGHSINGRGVAVGLSSNAQLSACRWIAHAPQPLKLPIGPNSMADSINESNQIVGWMGVSTGSTFFSQAFLWENGSAIGYVMPPNATSARAFSINNLGYACGSYSRPNPSGGASFTIPVFWPDADHSIDLDLLPNFIRCVARDINDSNTIVGYCQNPPQLGNALRAFISRNGRTMPLESLLVPGWGDLQVRRAMAINNGGQIAVDVQGPGVGGRPARLDPLPTRAGDTNCDWLVNVNDLLNVINAWGPAPPQIPFEGSPDLTADGMVNVNDLLTVINNWG